MKAYSYKLKINGKFEAACGATLDICRELYNAAIQERRDAYRINGLSINYHSQAIQLPQIRQVREDVSAVYSQVLQDTHRRVDKAFGAFFRRVRKGATLNIQERGARASGMVPNMESREPRISTYNAALGV